MSPLDDELRAALHGRARAVSPSPDPLLGIERRARSIRRNRLAASVAGSALAVAAIATAVPLLSTTPTSQPAPQASAPVETLAPTPRPTAAPATALDPADPWPYRGDRSLLDSGFPEVLDTEMAARRGVPDTAIEITPLFGQVYEPSGRAELVVLVEEEGFFSYVVAQATESGPEIVWENGIGSPTYALDAALAGDEVARLLVVSAPGTTAQYGPDSASEFASMEPLADGVSTFPLEGEAGDDVYRVVDAKGAEVFRAGAPDLATNPEPSDPPATSTPANLLDWPMRGSELAPDLEAALLDSYATALELDRSAVSYRPLFTGDTDAGLRYTLGQAWVEGGEAHTVSVALLPEGGQQFRLGPVTDPDTRVVAEVLCCQPGSTVDTLVVVPVPGTGQVLYDDDAEGSFRPVGEGQDFLDGVVLLDRDQRVQADRLQLLDGDGDAVRPLFQGSVESLLCGLRECG